MAELWIVFVCLLVKIKLMNLWISLHKSTVSKTMSNWEKSQSCKMHWVNGEICMRRATSKMTLIDKSCRAWWSEFGAPHLVNYTHWHWSVLTSTQLHQALCNTTEIYSSLSLLFNILQESLFIHLYWWQ